MELRSSATLKKSVPAFAAWVLKPCLWRISTSPSSGTTTTSAVFLARGSVLYREADAKRANMQDALHSVIDTAKMTSEYMAILEHAPQLKASGLVGDYRVLADFGDAVLAGHPTERGVQFVTWEWDWDREGVYQGNYFYEDYEAAKQDFTVRSGLVQKDALFETEQLAEFYHALKFVREREENLSFGRDQELAELMEQVGGLLSEAALRQRDAPEQSGMTMK